MTEFSLKDFCMHGGDRKVQFAIRMIHCDSKVVVKHTDSLVKRLFFHCT